MRLENVIENFNYVVGLFVNEQTNIFMIFDWNEFIVI